MDVIAIKQKFTILLLFQLLFTHFGFHLTFSYRLQHKLIHMRLGALAWLLNYFTRIVTGCHIDPMTIIGGGVQFPHPTGIVISRYAKIGCWCNIYQNVTIGSKNNKAPIIGNRVSIYPGACVIGNILIGNNAQIGANALVMENIQMDGHAYSHKAKITIVNINKVG